MHFIKQAGGDHGHVFINWTGDTVFAIIKACYVKQTIVKMWQLRKIVVISTIED